MRWMSLACQVEGAGDFFSSRLVSCTFPAQYFVHREPIWGARLIYSYDLC